MVFMGDRATLLKTGRFARGHVHPAEKMADVVFGAAAAQYNGTIESAEASQTAETSQTAEPFETAESAATAETAQTFETADGVENAEGRRPRRARTAPRARRATAVPPTPGTRRR